MTPLATVTPVPIRARRDGWTPVAQARFIFELARTHNVAAACRAVRQSWQSAYRLRHRPHAASFAAAADAALASPARRTPHERVRPDHPDPRRSPISRRRSARFLTFHDEQAPCASDDRPS